MQGEISDQELTEALARQDPERLYFNASDLACCGYPARSLRLLDEAIRRNYCAYPAIDADPTFASIRPRPEFAQIREAARACRTRFEQHVEASRQASSGIGAEMRGTLRYARRHTHARSSTVDRKPLWNRRGKSEPLTASA